MLYLVTALVFVFVAGLVYYVWSFFENVSALAKRAKAPAPEDDETP